MLLYCIGKDYDYAMDPFCSMNYLGKRVNVCSILLVIIEQLIVFVGTKRNKSILYSISSNTQWGVDTIVYQEML